MDEQLHLAIKTTMEHVALKVFPEINQQVIDAICKELASITEIYRNVLNESTIYYSGDWSGERFKQDFLMTSVWAIREGRQTEVWPNLKKASGELIIDCIMDMIESAKTQMSPDEIIAKGLVPKVIGPAAAIEILHKCYPKLYPMRSQRSEWGVAYFLFNGDIATVSGLSYSEFISKSETLVEILTSVLDQKGIKLPENCRFFVLEKLFAKMAEDPVLQTNNIVETSDVVDNISEVDSVP